MSEKAVVIGGGLGGLSVAISLANRGFEVSLFEKNDHLGGKLNRKEIEGFTFDLGPSILTLPHIFETLFKEAGREMADYVSIFELETHWRNFFEDGTVFDFLKTYNATAAHLETKFPGITPKFMQYVQYIKEQYRICKAGYFDKGIDSFWGMFRGTNLIDLLFKLDIYSSMHKRNTRFFGDTHLRDAFDYFIKYVGSSPLDSPGFMNLLQGVQFEDGLWYVEGGLFALSEALQKLAKDVGVALHTGSAVTKIITEEREATGIVVNGTSEVYADVIVSNMEVIPALRELTTTSLKRVSKLEKRFPPACSGLILHLGTNKKFDQLAHHNFFYAKNQSHHFKRVFHRGLLPDDPTLYVVAVTRSDPAQAPEGYDNIKILPHIPPLNPDKPIPMEKYDELADICIDKMERMGCVGLRESIVVQDLWTPHDIEAHYRSNRGAIYGVNSVHLKNFALKAPKKSHDFDGLYFVGGSVNPGGGMPMAVLSGINAAKLITGELKEL